MISLRSVCFISLTSTPPMLTDPSFTSQIRTYAHTDMGQSAYEDGGAQSAKSGSWNGLQVTAQHDATSALADVAEELTMTGQEKEEKKLTERKLKQQKGSPRRRLTLCDSRRRKNGRSRSCIQNPGIRKEMKSIP